MSPCVGIQEAAAPAPAPWASWATHVAVPFGLACEVPGSTPLGIVGVNLAQPGERVDLPEEPRRPGRIELNTLHDLAEESVDMGVSRRMGIDGEHGDHVGTRIPRQRL